MTTDDVARAFVSRKAAKSCGAVITVGGGSIAAALVNVFASPSYGRCPGAGGRPES